MLELLVYLLLFLIILNLLFSFLPAVDNRIAGIIILVLIIVLFFGGGRGGRRFWCANELPSAQDYSAEVQHDLHRGSQKDLREAS